MPINSESTTDCRGPGTGGRSVGVVSPHDNRHIAIESLSGLLQDELVLLSHRFGDDLHLESLGRLKEGADCTTKALVRTRAGRPVAVVVCSRPVSPDLIARGVERAEQIRSIIGSELAHPIIKPILSGRVEGRSYTVLPWFHDPPDSRLGGAYCRARLRRPALAWLREATRAASDGLVMYNAAGSFEEELRHLAEQPFLDGQMRKALERALARLADGDWQPRHTFDHNDLWSGNILLRDASWWRRPTAPTFVLIDWAGANPKGFGVYDLIRVARSFKLSASALRMELQSHGAALRCDLRDLEGHFLAAAGYLHRHIEYFPEHRFIATISVCWESLQAALAWPHSPPRVESAVRTLMAPVMPQSRSLRRRVAAPLRSLLAGSGVSRVASAIAGGGGAIILMYHSVTRSEEATRIDPANHVPAAVFEEQMKLLVRERRVIALDTLIRTIGAGKDPEPGSVVITFDDGYLDNLTVAAPILDSLGLRATLFLPTGYIDRGEPQWIDRACAAFQCRTRATLTWGDDAVAFDLDSDEQRASAYHEVCASLLTACFPERQRLLDDLERQLAPHSEPPRLTMTWNDVRRLLGEHDCFDLGAHTVNHIDLTRCSEAEAEAELIECRDRIEEQTGVRPVYFSFPYGRATPALRQIAARVGFISACGSSADPLLRAGTDPYALRRVKAPRSTRPMRFLTSAANSGLLHRLTR